jgi:hypothetical protein
MQVGAHQHGLMSHVSQQRVARFPGDVTWGVPVTCMRLQGVFEHWT